MTVAKKDLNWLAFLGKSFFFRETLALSPARNNQLWLDVATGMSGRDCLVSSRGGEGCHLVQFNDIFKWYRSVLRVV